LQNAAKTHLIFYITRTAHFQLSVKIRPARVFELLIMQSATEMVLTLLASLVGFRRECLVAYEEVVFEEMVTRSAAVEQIILQ